MESLLVMERIRYLLDSDSDIAVDLRLRTFFLDNASCYKVDLVDDDAHSRTYSVESTSSSVQNICLIKMDAHTETELADEEEFMGEDPMWFSETSHRVSPLSLMREAGERMGVAACPCIYITRATICNYEDIVSEWDKRGYSVWSGMRLDSLEIMPDAEPEPLEPYTPFRQLRRSNATGSCNEENPRLNQAVEKDVITIYLDEETGEYAISSRDSYAMDAKSFSDWLVEDLDKMPGLSSIKTAMREFADFVIYDELAKYANGGVSPHPDRITKSAVFLGNPGTGKTSVAKLYGTMLYNLGLLKSDEVRIVSRGDIINKPYYGAEEQNLARIVEEMEEDGGGVLFIDEAYTLCPEHDSKDPGHLVVTGLMRIMDTHPDIALVMAGYTEEMERFLDDNVGLRSRVAGRIFYFEDYDVDTLMQIALSGLSARNYTLTPAAVSWLEQHIEDAYADRDRHFGNGRFVEKLVERIFTMHAARIVRMGRFIPSEIMVIKAEDIPVYRPVRENPSQHMRL